MWTKRLERFHNLRALSGIVKGGFFLRKKPLYGSGAKVQQLWNRCSLDSLEALQVLKRVSRCQLKVMGGS
jgi:hypothetical protein